MSSQSKGAWSDVELQKSNLPDKNIPATSLYAVVWSSLYSWIANSYPLSGWFNQIEHEIMQTNIDWFWMETAYTSSVSRI